MGYVLACEVIAPGPYGPINARLLYVYPGGQNLCPGRDGVLRQGGLPLKDKVCACLELGILPRLRKPGVGEILKGVRIVLAGKKLLCHLRKPHKGGIEGVEPKGDLAGELGPLFYGPPLPVLEHLRLVPVGDHGPAFLANVGGKFRPVCVAHTFIIREFHLFPDKLYILAAMGARDKVVLYNVRPLQGFPNVAGL